MKRKCFPSLLILLGLALIFLTPGCAGDSPIMVACGQNYLIQAVLDANSDSDPTTLELEAGCTYNLQDAYSSTSNLNSYKGRTALPAITSPITMHGNGAVLEVTADDARHFYISGTGNLTIDDVVLISGKAIMGGWPDDSSGGGAIYNDGGVLRATDVTFRDNTAFLNGGAIHNRGTLVLDGCQFENNYGCKGGAVYSTDTDDIPLTVTDTEFQSNAGGHGGALYSEGADSKVAMDEVDFEWNSAEGHGGAVYFQGEELTFSGSNFNGNSTQEPIPYICHNFVTEYGLGGAIYFEGGQLNAVDSMIGSNRALTNGGGIFFSGEEFQCSNTEFGSNEAPLDGGGIYASGESLELSTCTFFRNATNESGGGLSAYMTEVEVETSEFRDNKACDRGGGMYMQGETLKVNLTEFWSNYAGGRFAIDWPCTGDVIAGGLYSDAEADINDSSFFYNQLWEDEYYPSLGLGGAIYNADQMSVDGCTIASNEARRGAGLYNAGDLGVVNSTFYANTGGEYGGAVYNEGDAWIYFSTIFLNEVSNNLGVSDLVGAGAYNGSGETVFWNSIVSENLSGGTNPDNCAVGSGELRSFARMTGTNLESMLSAQPDGWETCPYFFHVDGDTMGLFGDHGGPTLTVALVPGQSHAIDTVGICEYHGQWLSVDQRNVSRPQTECDIGAFELDDPDAPPPPQPPPVEPPPSPTVTPSPTPAETTCTYTALMNLNCRASDYKESKEIAILLEGDTAKLVALNPDYTHGKFETEEGKVCWIWLGLLDGLENPLGECKVSIETAPTPPPPPTCSPDLDEESCEASGGTWESGGVGEPECVCP